MANAASLNFHPQKWNSAEATISFSPAPPVWKLTNKKLGAELGFDTTGSFGLLKLTNKISRSSWVKFSQLNAQEITCQINDSSYLLKHHLNQSTTPAFIYNKFKVIKDPNGSLVLMLTFLADQLELQLYYVIYPNSAVIERWAELSSQSTIRNPQSAFYNAKITRLDSVNLNLSTAADKLSVYSITGLSQHLPYDAHIPHPSFIFQQTLLDEKTQDTLDIYYGSRSSERNLVWLAVQPNGSKDGIFTGIEWSGESRFVCKKLKEGFLISAGLTNFQHELKQGDRFVSPKAFFGVYSGSVDEASKATHQFCRAYLAPKVPDDFPWVMYNTWFAYGIDQDEDRMKKEIDNAAELGIEGFYLDAGWYQLSPVPAKTGNFDFSPGVGLWKENKEKYPSGIRALSDYCHRKGLKFGIWVEPERVDERVKNQLSDPLTDIMLAKRDNQPISGDGNKTMLLCLGNPEARKWLKRQLRFVVETYQIDWLKWDNNSWGNCNRPDHGHQAGDGNYAQIMGLYEVLDYLRQKFPNLIIENCASGGNRLDFGIMKRTHIFWVHDDSYTNYVCRYHHFGTAFAFPPEYLSSWVIQDGDFTRALGQNKTFSKPTLDYIFRSRFLGACGISLRTLDWSPELKQAVKRELEEYKKFRKYLKGEFYHLTPQTVIYNQTWEPPKSWEVFQYNLGDDSMVYYFRDDAENDKQTIFPQGIEKNKQYNITFLDTNEKITVTGAELINQGLVLKLANRFSSGIVIINPKSTPACC
ncbi:MAG: alpha-galactosidase [bacterium]|nr:alpha-galactosidase [bacterium]